MKSFKDFEPSVQCDECDKYLLIGDNPNNPIFETCDDCVRRRSMKEKRFMIRCTDTMNSYLLEHLFDSEQDAQDYIDFSLECRTFDSNCFEVEEEA